MQDETSIKATKLTLDQGQPCSLSGYLIKECLVQKIRKGCKHRDLRGHLTRSGGF